MLYFIYTQVQVLENLSTAGKLWYKINKAYITVSSPVSREWELINTQPHHMYFGCIEANLKCKRVFLNNIIGGINYNMWNSSCIPSQVHRFLR